MNSFLKNYKWSVFLRFWAQSYLELGLAALLGIQNFSTGNDSQISNTVISVTVFVFICVSPWIFLIFSYKNLVKIQKKDKNFVDLFSSLFYEFKNDNGFISTQYYFLFTMRRFIYLLNLTLLNDYPSTQVCINCVLSTVFVLFLAKFRPYEDLILQISNLLSEIGVLLFMGMMSVNLLDISTDLKDSVENAMVLVIMAVLITQTISSVAIFVRTCYQIMKLGLNQLNKKDNLKHRLNPVRNGNRSVANFDNRPEIDNLPDAAQSLNDISIDMTDADVID